VPPDLDAVCEGENPYAVTACHFMPGMETNVRDQDLPAVIAFRDTVQDSPHYRLASIPQVGSV